MIVLDACVVVDLLLNLPPFSPAIAQRVAAESPTLYAPHLLDAEVCQVLRRHVLRGQISAERAQAAFTDLLELPLQRYPHAPLLKHAFEFRDNATVGCQGVKYHI